MCDLSIIIPVFNNSRSIKHCLQSIFDNKTKYEYEVILVCDPSTDNTNKIIDEFAKKYNLPIKVVVASPFIIGEKKIENTILNNKKNYIRCLKM